MIANRSDPIPFRVKVCGVRTPDDIEMVGDSDADAIGLNFFPRSVRYVAPAAAVKLSEIAGQRSLERIGVFVNEDPDRIGAIVDLVSLEGIQMHGDGSLDQVRPVIERFVQPIYRAIKLPTGPIEIETLQRAVMPWIDLGCRVILDADAGPRHGGSVMWPQRPPATSGRCVSAAGPPDGTTASLPTRPPAALHGRRASTRPSDVAPPAP